MQRVPESTAGRNICDEGSANTHGEVLPPQLPPAPPHGEIKKLIHVAHELGTKQQNNALVGLALRAQMELTALTRTTKILAEKRRHVELL